MLWSDLKWFLRFAFKWTNISQNIIFFVFRCNKLNITICAFARLQKQYAPCRSFTMRRYTESNLIIVINVVGQ